MPFRFDTPIAHRGLHDRSRGVIENSASAFAAAMERGFAIECDLQLSKDGVPVVIHDHDLERLTGRKGTVIDYTAEDLGRIPLLGSLAGDCPQTFEQLLQQVAGKVLLQVELKRQHGAAAAHMLARKAAEAVARYGGPLVFESFDPALVALVKRYGFRGQRGIITERYDDLTEPEVASLSPGQRAVLRGLWHWPWTRFDFISADKKALELPAIRFWRALGKPVCSWTIRSMAEATQALQQADQIVFESFDPQSARG